VPGVRQDDAMSREQTAARLAFVVGTIARQLRPASEGLTYVAASALASVVRAGTIRPGTLAKVEGTSAPGMTRLLAELEQRGLIEREDDPVDGRSSLVRTTAAGNEALIDTRRRRAQRLEELLGGCTDAELETLERAVVVLERLMEQQSKDRLPA
jgi:DNA-binding MarR family transcriptional regulator